MDAVFVVLTNAVEGKEDEYNSWYSDQHLTDVVGLDGFKAAQRFVLADQPRAKDAKYKYLAIYEVDGDQMEKAQNALRAATKDKLIPISAALDPDTSALWYTPITDVVGG
jgi:hypothetical protein